FFFFSSRRLHTRSKRDWSSDVCSSDLAFFRAFLYCALRISEMDMLCDPEGKDISRATQTFHDLLWFSGEHYKSPEELYVGEAVRSEESRVGRCYEWSL